MNIDNQTRKNDRIIIKDPNLVLGYIQVPRPVLKTKLLSDRAKVVYALLLDYAWQAGHCFPGQETLAVELGTTVRTIQRALCELREYKLVAWEQRGVKQTNDYFILEVSKSSLLMPVRELVTFLGCYIMMLVSVNQGDTTKMSHHSDTTKMSGQDTTKMSSIIDSVEVHSDIYSNSKENDVESKLKPATQRSKSGLMKIGEMLKQSRGTMQDENGSVHLSLAMPLEGTTDRQETTKGKDVSVYPKPATATPSRASTARSLSPVEEQRIYAVYTQASNELGDNRHLRSNKTQGLNIFSQTHRVSVEDYIDLIYLCLGAVKEQAAAGAVKSSKMAYFFSMVRDKLNLPRSSMRASETIML